MENSDSNLENQQTNALSIYGQADAAMDDFPVLKAFQQYIDAEQSKSRKRMILLCMFFGALMTILVSVFVLVLGQMNRDKQHANDQLIQFLMKDRDRIPSVQQPVAQSNPATDNALKAMTESLTALQRQIADQRKADEEAAALMPTKAELELERKTEREAAKLRKVQEQIEAERRRLADEKERLRLEEVERQRRRLYPEYYQKQGANSNERAIPTSAASNSRAQRTTAPAKPQLSDADIDDILREVDKLRAEDEARERKDKESKKPAKKQESNDKETTDDKPIEYFTDSEYALPVKVNGEEAGWSVPLE